MTETLVAQGINAKTIICSKCFSHMLKNDKINTVNGGVRHKLSNQGQVSRFVHTYIAQGYASQSIDVVLKQHARLSKADSYKQQQKQQQPPKPKKRKVSQMTAKMVSQMKKLGWQPP